MLDQSFPSFENFRDQWLQTVTEGEPNTSELGRRFAHKIVTQWLDVSEATPDLIYCDGSGDGGIDVAYLDRGDDDPASTGDAGPGGHTWFLIQSKHGRAFQGSGTLLHEGQKVVDTLDGKRGNLSSLAEGLLERLTNFRSQASEHDKITLVFTTEVPLTEEQTRTLSDLRAIGRERLGPIFDVEAVSIHTIYTRLLERALEEESSVLTLSIKGSLVKSGPDLLVGVVNLFDLYQFLRQYRDQTQDIDRIYEKNVRKFLGSRGKVNKAIMDTLKSAPERFGLYNNGITIVVSDYTPEGQDLVKLVEPYIVNGCQTTRTIWEVFRQRFDAGGTGENPELEAWREQVRSGVIVTKVVKVGAGGEKMLQAITRYINSQNAVKDRDFLALTGDFRSWQTLLGKTRNLYLEIQRGGWESQKALQKQNPDDPKFAEFANAADLLKVYGAGWLGEAGIAFGKNPPFLPNGSIFKKIVEQEGVSEGEPFGADDLYAAHLIQKSAETYGFGRGAEVPARRQSRFLYYLAMIDLLRDVLSRSGSSTDHRAVSKAIVKLATQVPACFKLLTDQAVEVIDTYLTQGTDDSIFQEPAFLNTFNLDLNGFLKWE
jgi:hypothetical protein